MQNYSLAEHRSCELVSLLNVWYLTSQRAGSTPPRKSLLLQEKNRTSHTACSNLPKSQPEMVCPPGIHSSLALPPDANAHASRYMHKREKNPFSQAKQKRLDTFRWALRISGEVSRWRRRYTFPWRLYDALSLVLTLTTTKKSSKHTRRNLTLQSNGSESPFFKYMAYGLTICQVHPRVRICDGEETDH